MSRAKHFPERSLLKRFAVYTAWPIKTMGGHTCILVSIDQPQLVLIDQLRSFFSDKIRQMFRAFSRRVKLNGVTSEQQITLFWMTDAVKMR